MGMAVATEENLQPQHVAIFGLANDDRAGLGFQKTDAAQDQGAHDPLAEIGLGDEQRTQPVGLDHQRLYGSGRRCVDQSRPARHLCQFADEIARPVADDRLQAAGALTVSNVDFPGKDNHQAGTDLAGRQKCFTRGESLRFAEVTHPLDLDRIELGKHLIVTLFDQGLR
jgi:hypothetical protein